VNRIVCIREWGPDLFGRAQNRWRVIRTSNDYFVILKRQLRGGIRDQPQIETAWCQDSRGRVLHATSGETAGEAALRELLRELTRGE
jgi:hypothetical protein